MDVAVLDIGSRTVPVPVAHVHAVPEDPGDEKCSVTGVETRDTWPGTVSKLRMRATTATRVVTSPGTARSLRRRGSSFATPVERPVIWPATAIMPTSRSATPAVALATSRNSVTR